MGWGPAGLLWLELAVSVVKFLIDREFRNDDRLIRARSAHRAYWRRMSRLGVLVDGGEWDGGRGEMLVVKVEDRAALQRVLGRDPYVQERLVVEVRIRALGDLVGAEEGALAPGREAAASTDGLSAHEWRVARLMLAGLTNRQIADRFTVSPRAVEQHITRIYQKLSISRRAQLAMALNALQPQAGSLAAVG
ncbi:hypothetical protein GCM10010371_16430 [Streptomyces subrutilus]|uniref:HTH luxR-type domain-containing protein n=2 Tax=Streptomyces subrutilus TaxID=36818 RepID=A0A918QLL1_9ACTN|nr:hypothetical protein GCM10010371_16430 [Streptomyces subrutilus]